MSVPVDELTEVQDKFYVINKPREWSSFDVVKKIRNLGRFKKIGHAGITRTSLKKTKTCRLVGRDGSRWKASSGAACPLNQLR